jgi:hypothetical protein
MLKIKTTVMPELNHQAVKIVSDMHQIGKPIILSEL